MRNHKIIFWLLVTLAAVGTLVKGPVRLIAAQPKALMFDPTSYQPVAGIDKASLRLQTLGMTAVGNAFSQIATPADARFPRINADGTVSSRTAAEFLSDIGGGTQATWGNITGTIGDQADLSAALAAKQTTDADLTTYASITPSANTQSFLAAADYSAMRSLLGLVIGTNVQAYDADLSAYAAITPSANVQTLLGAANYSAFRTSLSLVIGTDVQAFDSDLSTYAGITPSANVQSFLGAANYSAMRSLLTLVPGTDVQAYSANLAAWSALATNTKADLTTNTFAGIQTYQAASVTSASAMGALVIDVTKALNTKTVSGDNTFTFSGTPANSNQWFSTRFTNSGGSTYTQTIPSSFDVNSQTTITSFKILAGGTETITWCYDGATYFAYGVPGTGYGAEASVASATTTDIGAADSINVSISGTTTITGLGTAAAGTYRQGRFTGALTFTHNGTSLILPNNGSNITTAANDRFGGISLGSGNWLVLWYQRASGAAVAGGGGDALTTNPLSQFASTTSAQLRGVLSDESGTGTFVTQGGDVGAATGTTASAGDSDTSVATTAFVHGELDTTRTGTHASPTTTNPLSPTWTGLMHVVWYGATGTINLPAAASYAGKGILVYNTGAFTITIDSNSSEVIVRDGNVQTGGVSMTLSSGAGNYVALVCDGSRWVTVGYKGTLAVGS